MELANRTAIKEFILLGFGADQETRFPLLIIFTTLYLLTLLENITIVTLVVLDAHLAQLPMYILLSNFSWLEMCYVTITVPRLLFDLSSPLGVISFQACFLQFYLFFSIGCTECLFLSAMALDRYVAICHPLQYHKIMSPSSCHALVASCWVLGFLWYIFPVCEIFNLSFCGPNIINHFMCDLGPILSLACPPLGNASLICDVFLNVLVLGNVFFVVLLYSVVIFTLTKASYEGSRKKAFSTISFHLMVVTLFYGSGGGIYLTPWDESQSEITKTVTVFYTTITPVLNPLIYCLRNEQVKKALRRLLRRMEKSLAKKRRNEGKE